MISKIKIDKVVLCILLLAAILRFLGVNPSYNQFHSDEGISYSAATEMIKKGDLDPRRFDYPAVVPLSNYLFFNLFFIPVKWVTYYSENLSELITGNLDLDLKGSAYRKLFQEEILGSRDINALIWGRYVTAFFSIGSVFLLYLVGHKLFGKKIALISMIFLAVNFRAVTNAHIGLPDTYNAFFILLALYQILRTDQNPSFRNYILTGIAIGISTSTKYQFFTIFPFIYLELCRNVNYKNLPKSFLRVISFKFLTALFLIPITFVILNPYFFYHFDEAMRWTHSVSLKYAMGRQEFLVYPFSYFYHIDYGVFLSVFILIGIIISLRKYLKQFVFLSGVLLPFFFITTYYSIGGFYVRNFISVTPLILFFGAVGFIYIIELLEIRLKLDKTKKTILFILLLTITIYPTLKNALINSYFYTQPWTYNQIVNKASLLLKDGDVVASHPFDPLPKNLKLTRSDFKTESAYSIEEFKENEVNYALINMDWAGNPFYGWMNQTIPDSIRDWNKPTDRMRNTIYGLSIEEMMQYVVTSAYKPWQAPDAALFLVRIPNFQNLEYETINTYDFKDLLNWKSINTNNNHLFSISNNGGVDDSKSLKLNTGMSSEGLDRIVSEAIPVREYYIYKISVDIKSDKLIEKSKRIGFLRLDFYSDDQSFETVGITSNISARYYGDTWKTLEVYGRVPKTAKFMRVSFQSGEIIESPLYIDNLIIQKSKSPFNKEKDLEQINFEEYKDLLYANSHGNL